MKGILLSISMVLSFLMVNTQQPMGPDISLQNKQIDSLFLIIKNSMEDTAKVNQLFELGLQLNKFDRNDDILKYGTEALSLSRKINYQRGIGLSYFLKSLYYFNKTNYLEALKDIFAASLILDEKGDKKNVGKCANLIASIFFYLGKYPEAIQYWNKALEILKETGDKSAEPGIYNKLGTSACYLGNHSQGLDYYYKALFVSEELGDKGEMAYSLQLIGTVFFDHQDYSLALKNIIASRKINLETGDKYRYAQNNNTIGEIYVQQGKYAEALQIFCESLKIYEEPGAPRFGIPWCYSSFGLAFEGLGDSIIATGNKKAAEINYKEAMKNYIISNRKHNENNDIAAAAMLNISIAAIYIKLKKIPDAKKYLQAGLKVFTRIGSKESIAYSYLYLSQIDSIEKNYEKAFDHYKLYIIYRDSVFNSEESRKIELYKTQFEFEKKEQELKLLAAENELKTSIAQKQIQQKKFAYGVIAAVLLLTAFGFYRYRRYSRLRSEEKLLRDRLLISQDLHDNVGSTLSSISVFSKVAQLQSEENKKEELQEVLEKINIISGDMVAEMNDTVWAINPRNDSMEKIIQRMESFAKPLLATRNISFLLDYEPSVLTVNLGMEKRKNFYFIFKEAVNNAFKYSGSSEINAEITNTGKQLELIIKDNGVGFDLQHEMKENKLTLSGNGLRNMQMRAEEMKGSLLLDSSPGKGTEIKLSIPIP